MTIDTTTRSSETVVAGRRQPNWLVQVLGAVARLIRHRRETAQLLEMDDRKLADIGLSRADVIHALNGSLLHDPTRELSRLAGRRP